MHTYRWPWKLGEKLYPASITPRGQYAVGQSLPPQHCITGRQWNVTVQVEPRTIDSLTWCALNRKYRADNRNKIDHSTMSKHRVNGETRRILGPKCNGRCYLNMTNKLCNRWSEPQLTQQNGMGGVVYMGGVYSTQAHWRPFPRNGNGRRALDGCAEEVS